MTEIHVDGQGLRCSRRSLLRAGLGATTAIVAVAGAEVPALASSSQNTMRNTSIMSGPHVVQAPALPGAQPISSYDRIYTADQTSNTITVINPATDEVLGTFPFGNERLDGILGPQYLREIGTHGLGFSQDGSMLDVINVTTNSAFVFNTATNTVARKFYVGRAPHEGFIAPNGRELWVAVRGLDYVSVLGLGTGREITRVKTAPNPSKVVFSPDGRLAYVNHIGAAELDVIDVASYKVIKRITGIASSFSSDEAISPDGEEVWLPHKKTGQLTVVDAKRFRVLTILTTGPDTNHPNFVTKPDAKYAYLTVGGFNETQVYLRNGAYPRLIKRIKNSGADPHGIWPSPDNTRIYVALQKSDAVDIIDTTAMAVLKTIRVGQSPMALVYVANAVPQGDGRQNLTQQGLGLKVITTQEPVRSSTGIAEVTVRELETTDYVHVESRGLLPNTVFTVYALNNDGKIPLADLKTDGNGVGETYAFTRFFGIFTRVIIAPQGE